MGLRRLKRSTQRSVAETAVFRSDAPMMIVIGASTDQVPQLTAASFHGMSERLFLFRMRPCSRRGSLHKRERESKGQNRDRARSISSLCVFVPCRALLVRRRKRESDTKLFLCCLDYPAIPHVLFSLAPLPCSALWVPRRLWGYRG